MDSPFAHQIGSFIPYIFPLFLLFGLFMFWRRSQAFTKKGDVLLKQKHLVCSFSKPNTVATLFTSCNMNGAELIITNQQFRIDFIFGTYWSCDFLNILKIKITNRFFQTQIEIYPNNGIEILSFSITSDKEILSLLQKLSLPVDLSEYNTTKAEKMNEFFNNQLNFVIIAFVALAVFVGLAVYLVMK